MASTTVGGLGIRRLDRLDERACALLRATNVCVVSTIGPGGAIQSLPVWVDTDGEHVLLNTVGGRAWVRNLDRTKRVTCTTVNNDNNFEFLEVRGHVVGAEIEGAEEHIDTLAQKYLGRELYPWHDPEQPRLLYRVIPDKIIHMHPAEAELPAVASEA
jgi:PPOX class probable F420-dependent enzyme